jgi:hypothetical protein
VATGGGLGGLRFALGSRSIFESLDIYAGLYPFLELLVNPHFLAGTALLLLALLRYDRARGLSGWLLATVAGSALGLVRPYDLVLLVGIRGLTIITSVPPGRWLGAFLSLAGLLPVVGYLYWLFYVNPAFAFYATTEYSFPSRGDFAWALAPGVLLAGLGVLSPAQSAEATRARSHLIAWVILVFAVIAVQPVGFSLQFFVGVGFPLLGLGALTLNRLSPLASLGVAAVFSTSCLVALHFLMTPNPFWFKPREALEMTAILEKACRPGDRLFAPPDIGLYALGLTRCRPVTSHAIEPDHARRLAEVSRFAERSPAERSAQLEAEGVRLLVLPGDAGPVPRDWLGEGTGFRREAVVRGMNTFSLYALR